MGIITLRKRKLYKGFRKKIPTKRVGTKTKSYIPRRMITVGRGQKAAIRSWNF